MDTANLKGCLQIDVLLDGIFPQRRSHRRVPVSTLEKSGSVRVQVIVVHLLAWLQVQSPQQRQTKTLL